MGGYNNKRLNKFHPKINPLNNIGVLNVIILMKNDHLIKFEKLTWWIHYNFLKFMR